MPSSKIANNLLELIGNTPMIKLTQFNPNLTFNLYVKCEMFNPSLSIKDRIVLSMIRDLEKQQKLKPGNTIIEASSGNTGSSLAMIAAILGYKAMITVPKKTSQEKIKTMLAYGAEVIICPSDVAADSPEHYINQVDILASKTPGSVCLGQYSNPINVQTHYEQTAHEIWQQMGSNIDYFVAAASTGGTITGIGKYLKEKNPDIKIIMPDPVGSIFYHYFHEKNTDMTPTAYRVEGAGKDKICPIHDFDLIDDVVQFTDDEAFDTVRKLAQTEGILAGGSSGGALSVAEKLETQIKPQSKSINMVVMLPDSGFKYLSN